MTTTEPTTGPTGGRAGARVSRARERFEGESVSAVDPGPLLGSWVNFDLDTPAIRQVDLAERDGALHVTVYGAGDPEPVCWGEVPATVYADDVARSVAFGFSAAYDLGHARVLLVGYVNRALLTVEPGTVFTDGSGRSPYFTRAHLHPR